MNIGTVDIYHFIPVSLTLSLLGGHKVSAKQHLWSHFLAHFSTDQYEISYDVEAIQIIIIIIIIIIILFL